MLRLLAALLVLSLTPAAAQDPVAESPRDPAAALAGEDQAITTRLRSMLGAIDRFRGIEVKVTAGIVVLTGEAPSRAAIEQAGELAGRVDGVLLVVNEVALQTGLEERVDGAWIELQNRLRSVFGSLPIAGIALLVLAGFWLLARLLRDARWPYRLLSRRTLLQDLMRQTVFVLVLLLGMIATLRLVDATAVLGTLLGAAGVVGLALGFAFRNIVENYLAGILLAIRQPFRARDQVSIDGARGTVLRMTSSETLLLDLDGNHLRLPNGKVFNGTVVNFTRNPLRRFTVTVGVGTAVDLAATQDLGVAMLGRMNGVVADPGPSARVAALGDSTVTLEFFGWVDQAAANYVKVASEAHRLLKETFDAHGIGMPAPTYNLVFEEASPAVPGGRAKAGPKRPVRQQGPAPEAIEVAVPDDTTGQVEKELARSDEPDLLDDAAGPPAAVTPAAGTAAAPLPPSSPR